MSKSRSNGDAKVYSKKTENCLRVAGWLPNREIPLNIYETAFAEENLPFPPIIRSFLSRYGGLIISYKNLAQQDDTLDFLADEAVQGLGNDRLRSYEEIAASGKLCPIGHYAFGSCLLLMTIAGRVYGGQDCGLHFVGQSGPHAIENIVMGKPLEPIHRRAISTNAEG